MENKYTGLINKNLIRLQSKFNTDKEVPLQLPQGIETTTH